MAVQNRDVNPTPIAVWIVALIFVALQLGFGPRYPIFRDEFYYLACADHPALGYVDHPPLSILILAAWRAAFGDSIVSLRVLPSLAGGLIVWLTSRLAGAIGGGAFAQTFAAVAVLAAPTVLGITSFYSMNAFDFLFWLGGFLFILRLSRTEAKDATPTWAWFGMLLGLGLLNKISVLVLGAGLAAVLVLTPMRAHLRTRGPWLAALIAFALFAPYVLWQVQNDWPTLEFINNAAKYKNVSLGPWGFFKSQLLDFGPLNALFWIPGFIWLIFAKRMRPYRSLAIVFVVAFLSFMNGKAYYLAPAMLIPLVAGAVFAEHVISKPSLMWMRPVVLIVLLLAAALPSPVVVPILNPEDLGPYMRKIGLIPKSAEKSALGVLPQHFADRFGWEELTDITARAWTSLSDEERRTAIIATSNYGEAGAINYYGRSRGLPTAVSQHNNFFLWGPGRTDVTVVIAIGSSAEDLRGAFEDVQPVAAMTNPFAMPYERENAVTICRKPKNSLVELWKRGKKFI
ncbi:MAG: glycosyltransferase family 39 protein [Vicinamibacteria bacterium]